MGSRLPESLITTVRWTGRRPDSVDGTTTVANPYHYTDNDPINKADPLGLRARDAIMQAAKAVDECRGYFAVESYILGGAVPAFHHCGEDRGDAVATSPHTGQSYESIACAVTLDLDVVFGDGDWSKSECDRALRLSDLAIDRAAREYPGVPNSGTNIRNAFQHAYWNTLMTIELGERVADAIATNHELYNVENTPNEYVMDMRNNYVGRTIGRPLRERFATAFDVAAQDAAAAAVRAAADNRRLCVQSPAPASGPCNW
jgi:hypothetical protein